MSTEKLIVELDANTKKLDSGLDKSNAKLKELDGQTKKSDKSLNSFGKAASVAGGAIVQLSKAAIAVGTALTTMITLTAKGEQELQVFAKTARTTTGDFEALAFAAKSVGLDAKGTADAMNDVNERLAEFGVGDGAGAFDDFAQAMGLTKDEAKAVASELKELSGEDALRELVKQMEEAGTSTADMNFVLKSLSNDLAYASGLFEDNGKELDRLKDRYNEVNKALSITQEEAKGLTNAAESFDLLTESIGNGTKLISAQLAPALDEFFNSVIDVVPEATQAIVDFINSFKDTENISNEQTLTNQIEDQKNAIEGLKGKIIANQNVIDKYYGSTRQNIETQKRLNEELKQEQKELEGIEAQLKKVQEEKEANASTSSLSGGDISATIGTGESSGDQLQSLLDRFKSEEQLLLEKYENERTIAADNNTLLLELELEYQENLKAIREEARLADLESDQAAFDAMNDLRLDSMKAEGELTKEQEKQNKLKTKSDQAYLGAAVDIGNAFFEDNKAVKAGLVVVDTAAGISKAFAELPYPAALAASAGIAATGVAQLAAIQSASKGGGSTSSAVPAEEAPQEAPTLEAQNTDADGSNQTVTIKFDDSTELGVAFNNAIERSRQDGLI